MRLAVRWSSRVQRFSVHCWGDGGLSDAEAEEVVCIQLSSVSVEGSGTVARW